MKKFYFIILFASLFISNSATSQNLKNTWEISGMVNAMTADNQYTYLGGIINYYGPVTGAGAQITTGNTSPNLRFPIVDGKIYTCTPDGNGGWFIGGKFKKVGKYNRENLAHINADGTVSDWNPGANNIVSTITVDDSTVYIGGYFTSTGNVKRNYLAKINKFSGKVDKNWNPDPDNFVLTLAVSDQYLYVGGWFEKMGTTVRKFLARLGKKTGIPDDAWNPIPNGVVKTIVLSGNVVYLGGGFTSFWVGGVAYYAAKLNNTDGHFISPFWYPNPDDEVDKIIPVGDRVYLAGNFYHIGRVHDTVVPRVYVACVDNAKGKPNLSWNPNPDEYVNDIYVNNHKVYLAGGFKTLGNTNKKYLARVDDWKGQIDSTWMPKSDAPVYCLGFAGQHIFVGGSFTSIGGVACHNLIRLRKSDYSIDTTWMPKMGNAVSGIVLDNKNIYVSGSFLYIDNVLLPYLAKIDYLTGKADSSWTPPVVGPVNSMAAADSALYLGGSYIYKDYNHPYLARMLKTGKPARVSWWRYPHQGLLGDITKVAVNGNFLYASGILYNEDRTHVIFYFRRMSRTTGIEDNLWNPAPDHFVRDMAFHGNNVFAAGDFHNIGGQAHKGLAKIDLVSGAASGI